VRRHLRFCIGLGSQFGGLDSLLGQAGRGGQARRGTPGISEFTRLELSNELKGTRTATSECWFPFLEEVERRGQVPHLDGPTRVSGQNKPSWSRANS